MWALFDFIPAKSGAGGEHHASNSGTLRSGERT